MELELKPTPAMGPFSVTLRRSTGFYLRRTADDDSELGEPEFVDRLFVEHAEVSAFRAALAQVRGHPYFVEGRWETSRSWLSAEPPHNYTSEVIVAANVPWEVSRTRAAVVIAGPLWNPLVWPNGAFRVEIEYARLNELVEVLNAA